MALTTDRSGRAAAPLRQAPSAMVVWELVFAMTSLIYEPYIMLGVDLAACRGYDIVGRSWHWYAASFDPVFLTPPPLLRLMCGLDCVMFGPFHFICAYALLRRRPWIRTPALVVNRCARRFCTMHSLLCLANDRVSGESCRTGTELGSSPNLINIGPRFVPPLPPERRQHARV